MSVYRRTKTGGIGRLLLGLYWPLLVFGGISAAAYLVKGGPEALLAAVLRILESPSGSLGTLILGGVCLLLTPAIIILTLQQQKDEKAASPTPMASPDELFPGLDYRLTPHSAIDSIQLFADGKELLSLPAAPGSRKVQAGGLTLTLTIEGEPAGQPQAEPEVEMPG